MKFDKQALRKAAEKATEGNYVVGHCDINKHGNLSSVYVCQEWNGEAGGVVAEFHVNCLTKNSDQVYANAGFMAFASPANVISLLEEISALEARCAALAAELSAVEEIHNEAVFITDDHYEQCPPEVQKIIRSLAVMQIPAYQAFLAEVRAAAVDEVCLKISNAIVNCYQDEQIGLDAAATICGDFTAQLRKGVQS
ncbi:ead/Ea22-like family protein [Enterobacter cloacae]